jgi:hypothetical protein
MVEKLFSKKVPFEKEEEEEKEEGKEEEKEEGKEEEKEEFFDDDFSQFMDRSGIFDVFPKVDRLSIFFDEEEVSPSRFLCYSDSLNLLIDDNESVLNYSSLTSSLNDIAPPPIPIVPEKQTQFCKYSTSNSCHEAALLLLDINNPSALDSNTLNSAKNSFPHFSTDNKYYTPNNTFKIKQTIYSKDNNNNSINNNSINNNNSNNNNNSSFLLTDSVILKLSGKKRFPLKVLGLKLCKCMECINLVENIEKETCLYCCNGCYDRQHNIDRKFVSFFVFC